MCFVLLGEIDMNVHCPHCEAGVQIFFFVGNLIVVVIFYPPHHWCPFLPPPLQNQIGAHVENTKPELLLCKKKTIPAAMVDSCYVRCVTSSAFWIWLAMFVSNPPKQSPLQFWHPTMCWALDCGPPILKGEFLSLFSASDLAENPEKALILWDLPKWKDPNAEWARTSMVVFWINPPTRNIEPFCLILRALCFFPSNLLYSLHCIDVESIKKLQNELHSLTRARWSHSSCGYWANIPNPTKGFYISPIPCSGPVAWPVTIWVSEGGGQSAMQVGHI